MPDLLHVLHVAGAVFAVGPLAVLPMLGLRAIREGDRPQIRGLARSTVAFAAATTVIGVLGFGAMSTADEASQLSVTTTWILWSIVFSGIAVVLQFAVVVPALFRAAEGTESGANSRPYLLVAGAAGVPASLLAVTVLLMIVQPA